MKKQKFLLTLFLIVLTGVLISYFAFFDTQVMPEEKFVSFYYDYVIAQDSLGYDVETAKKVREELFVKYQTNERMYIKTIDYYSEDPKRWEIFFDKVMKKMEDTRKTKTEEP
ncbi:MAG TPA: DUF4296 domain-containing protein [Ignavibacteriaceae bacterium]|nr:DUF4296 domain-containing protein [Ignavibacteriaceae bacterium]